MKKKIAALILTVLMVITLLGTSTILAAENLKPIVVQGAMNVEVQKMVQALDNAVETTYGSWTFWQGTIDQYPVVVVRTEVGVTNAAASTTLAIEKFQPGVIINQGTSGGHDPALHRYDIVLGKKSINFGMFRSEHKDYGAGIKPEEWIAMSADLRLNGEEVSFHGFEGDANLIAIAEQVKAKYTNGKVVQGVIGTADEWNRELDRIQLMHEKYNTSTEEMETASAAQVAKAYNIPFLGIRILSNSEIHGEGFDPKAGEYCQEYVLEVVKALIKQYQTK